MLKPKSFEEAHAEGSKAYGTLWLKVNQVISDVAKEFKVDIKKPASKGVMSNIALSLLNNFEVKEKTDGQSTKSE